MGLMNRLPPSPGVPPARGRVHRELDAVAQAAAVPQPRRRRAAAQPAQDLHRRLPLDADHGAARGPCERYRRQRSPENI